MIRAATIDDVPAIADLAMVFWAAGGQDHEPDRFTIEAMIEMCISQDLMCILEIDGKAEGFAAGMKGASLANVNVACGNEIAWWVNPEHRGGRNGIALMKFLEGLAKKAGIRYWTMGFMESSMPRVIESIYQRLGYKKAEVSYMKELI